MDKVIFSSKIIDKYIFLPGYNHRNYDIGYHFHENDIGVPRRELWMPQ